MKKLLGLIVLSACFLSMVPVLAAPVTSAPLMTAAEFKEREEENRNKVEFKRNAAETKVNLALGPFAYGAASSFGFLAGLNVEFWNLDKSYIQNVGVNMIKSSATSINIFGSFYYEALPRLYAGPMLGLDYKEHTGFVAMSLRLLGPDPSGQKFFSILFTQIDLGIRSSSSPYGALSFGFKLI